MAMEEARPNRSFGWQGWLLVVAIILAMLVIPLIIFVRPPTDLSYRFAFLILPLGPALILGILAVWVATRP